MDPVHVTYGLLLIALATAGFTAANRILPWRIFASAALLAGLGEWVETFSLPYHGGLLMAICHASLHVSSAILLVVGSHATRGAMRGSPILWLSVLALSGVLLTVVFGPFFGVIAGVVMPAFMIAGWAWWRASRINHMPVLAVGAVLFVAMTVLTAVGLMTSHNDPMAFHEGWRPWVASGLVLALIVVTAVAADAGLSDEHRWARWRQGIVALSAILVVIAATSWFGRWQSARERLAIEAELNIHATAVASELRSRLVAGDIFAQMLAGRELTCRSLAAGADADVRHQLDRELASLVDRRRISLLYVMTPDGRTVAASNFDQPESLVGKNFAFRAYVKQALTGRIGRQWAMGAVTGVQGFYHAAPVRDKDGAIIGVAAIKQDSQVIKGLMPTGIMGWILDEVGQVFIAAQDSAAIGQAPVVPERSINTRFAFPDETWSVVMATTDDRLREVVLPVYLIMGLLGLLICPNFALLIGREMRRLEQTGHRAVLAQVVDASPDAMALIDGDGRIRLVNRAMTALVGQDARTLEGQQLEVLLPAVPGTGTTAEMRIATPAGDRVLQATRVALAMGNLVVATDVTALRTAVEDAEAARRRVEELQCSTAAYLATISHEIRSPLGGVVSLAEVLASGDLSPEQTERVDALRRSVEGILNLLNDVLDHGRLESGHLELVREPFDPATMVMDVVDTMLPRLVGRSVEVVVWTDASLPRSVLGDAGRLRQVVANLLSNAMKFTERGEVIIELSAPAPGRLRIVVADTGPGIPADRIGRIFNPYQQADATVANRFGGTGLGLSISSRLVALMDGRITVDSVPGRGSRFTVEVAAGPVADDREQESAPTRPRPGTRLLVVDDHPRARAAMMEAMASAGCCVVGAADGHEAVQAIAEAAAKGAPFEAAIIDRELPGHGGLWLLSALRSRPGGAALPVVLVTASPQRGDGEACTMAGIDAYLVKPARPWVLAAAVAKSIQNHSEPSRALITRRAIEEERQRPRPRRPMRVLLAEDLPLNRQVFTLLLEDAGCTVVLAEDGNQAQAALRQGGIDLVLMDVNMPHCDGRTATRAWRAAEVAGGLPRVPIIALTGEDGVDDRARCIESGMDDYLPKPFREEELRALLLRWSNSFPSSNQAR